MSTTPDTLTRARAMTTLTPLTLKTTTTIRVLVSLRRAPAVSSSSSSSSSSPVVSFGIVDKDDDDDDDFDGADPPSRGGRRTNDGDIGGGFSGRRRRRRRRAGLVARTRLARTEADAEACARTCGEAFAREDAERGLGWGHGYYYYYDDGGGGGGDDFVDVGRRVVETARRAADDAFAESIASELKTMTTHQINERVEASVKRRAINVEKVEGMTNEELRRRRVELERLKRRSQCLTVLASLSASDDTDDDDDDDDNHDDDDDDDDDGEEERIAGDESSSETEWIGSANIRVCAPEALFPEPFPTTKPRVPYISNVAVRRDARRRGVAGVMLDKCERAARVWGFPEVWIHVDVDNPIVRVAYERRGYVARSEDPWWYGFGGLFGKRRVLMVKRFTVTTTT